MEHILLLKMATQVAQDHQVFMSVESLAHGIDVAVLFNI